jgi:hypothetical protein
MSSMTSFRAGGSWRRFEAVYERFEQAWNERAEPSNEDYLPPPVAPEHGEVAKEPMRIDFESNAANRRLVHGFPEIRTEIDSYRRLAAACDSIA